MRGQTAGIDRGRGYGVGAVRNGCRIPQGLVRLGGVRTDQIAVHGKVDPGDTNPLDNKDCGPGRTNKDTDCDGLTDQVETAVSLTSPTNPDSDGDGILDGREVGVTVNPDAASCPNAFFVANVFDNDTANLTSPRRVDTDCDGLPDGQEDTSQDGQDDVSLDAPPDTLGV